MRSSTNRRHASTGSSSRSSRGRRTLGVPGLNATTIDAGPAPRVEATRSAISGSRRPDGSLTIDAPRRSASSATRLRYVSTEIVTPGPTRPRTASSTGSRRSSSISTGSSGWSVRNDCAPMSSTSAPSATMASARSAASSAATRLPENDSGDAFSTAKTDGRRIRTGGGGLNGRSSRRAPARGRPPPRPSAGVRTRPRRGGRGPVAAAPPPPAPGGRPRRCGPARRRSRGAGSSG